MTETAVRITELRAENIKRIKAVEIHPRGNVVEISGKNRAGKSSVLDSIAMALGGKAALGDKPLRNGASKGKIVLTLDNGLIVTRTITEDGGSLTVTSAEGAKFPSPQAMLDRLVGDLSFDPLAFAEMTPAEQRETLKRLVGVDTSDLDAARSQTYEERTVVNRTAGQQKSRLATMAYHADAPEAEVSVADLMQQLTAAEETGHVYRDAKTSFDTAVGEEKRCAAEVDRLQRALFAARQKLLDATAAAEACDSAAAAARGKLVDAAPIKEAIENSEAINRKVRANADRSKLIGELRESEEQAERLSKRIESIDAEKVDLLASAKFPVAGLSFDESGVLFNGVPFSQASSAEQIEISVAMGMAMNPTLRVILVRNASLMDADMLAVLTGKIEAADYQVWLERVDSTGTVGIVIEDGTVKTVNRADDADEAPTNGKQLTAV